MSKDIVQRLEKQCSEVDLTSAESARAISNYNLFASEREKDKEVYFTRLLSLKKYFDKLILRVAQAGLSVFSIDLEVNRCSYQMPFVRGYTPQELEDLGVHFVIGIMGYRLRTEIEHWLTSNGYEVMHFEKEFIVSW